MALQDIDPPRIWDAKAHRKSARNKTNNNIIFPLHVIIVEEKTIKLYIKLQLGKMNEGLKVEKSAKEVAPSYSLLCKDSDG